MSTDLADRYGRGEPDTITNNNENSDTTDDLAVVTTETSKVPNFTYRDQIEQLIHAILKDLSLEK